jgi:hypothetical protein
MKLFSVKGVLVLFFVSQVNLFSFYTLIKYKCTIPIDINDDKEIKTKIVDLFHNRINLCLYFGVNNFTTVINVQYLSYI